LLYKPNLFFKKRGRNVLSVPVFFGRHSGASFKVFSEKGLRGEIQFFSNLLDG
jgi:hypothetical protein